MYEIAHKFVETAGTMIQLAARLWEFEVLHKRLCKMVCEELNAQPAAQFSVRLLLPAPLHF